MKLSISMLLVSLLIAAAAEAQPGPALVLDASVQTSPGVPVSLPLGFTGGGQVITAIAFSLDLDPGLVFDLTDTDLDGVPDAVTLPAGLPAVLVVDHDPGDPDGEIDVLMANLSGAPLAQGIILEFELTPTQSGTAASWIRFSEDPWPSFANDQGEDVCGSTEVLGIEDDPDLVFADGFESGNACSWTRPPS